MLLVVSCLFSALWANGTTETGKKVVAYPSQPIEFVIPGSAGGGSDILGRTISDIIQKYGLVNQTITVVNKGGGASAVAHGYVNSKSDPDNYIFTTNSANLLSMYVNKSMSPKGPFTPLACMALDEVLFVARTDGPFKTWADVQKALKSKPASLTIGEADDFDAMARTVLEREAGVKFNTTAYFASSGEVATALLGGHLDVAILNPNECIGLVEGNRLTVLGAFSPKRLNTPFDKAPTFAELGYPKVVMQMYRGVMGPALMSREAQQYWSGVLKKVSETEEWKKNYISKNVLTDNYMDCDAFAKFIKDSEDTILPMAREMGVLK